MTNSTRFSKRLPCVIILTLAASSTCALAGAIEITSDTFVGCSDSSLDGLSVTVNGAILTIDCHHSLNSLTVINGGLVRHSIGEIQGCVLNIATDLLVDSSSAIDVSSRGYGAASGPGAGASATQASGGGHGGNGGPSTEAQSNGGSTYGQLHDPTSLGSGGGNGLSKSGGLGGGYVRLIVGGIATTDGIVSADGQDRNINGGGGAGGSVVLHAQQLLGSGTMSANGGSSFNPTNGVGGGGGGRIALVADTSGFLGAIEAHGGTSDPLQGGGAGSIFIQQTQGGPSELLYDNFGVEGVRTNLVFPMPSITDVRVRGNAILSHRAGINEFVWPIGGNLVIESDGAIDVSRRGFPAATGPGLGNSATIGSGAGHGGRGGGDDIENESRGGSSYDSLFTPTEFGSGGGNSLVNPGNPGGGRVRLDILGDLSVDGIVAADGGGIENGGGGAGGSILVVAENLIGGGSIVARGGSVVASNGAGGGGRIAIYADTFAFVGLIQAQGGSSVNGVGGGAGSILRQSPGVPGVLVFDNDGVIGATTDMDGENAFTGDVFIRRGAQVSHTRYTPGFHWIINGDLHVESDPTDGDGAVTADWRGFPPEFGPGAGQSAEIGAGGAGYGGIGEAGLNGSPGLPYGCASRPLDLGSGGGEVPGGGTGGRGGGAIRFTINGSLLVNGRISADGEEGCCNLGPGGGSGGSILIQTNELLGTGVISANGGPANGGAGGGGRIAVYFQIDTSAVTVNVLDGDGVENGTVISQSGVAPGPVTHQILSDSSSIQSKIDELLVGEPVVCTGDEILVHPGIYVENINLRGKGIWLHSVDGPATTVIEAQGSAGSVIRCSTGELNNCVVQGFTLRNGSGTLDSFFGVNLGGGAYISAASPTFRDCVFFDNTATWGAGATVSRGLGTSLFENCDFSNNVAEFAAGINVLYSDANVFGCDFDQNQATVGPGGAAGAAGSPSVANTYVVFDECTFSGNQTAADGGALTMNNYSRVDVRDSVFDGNTAVEGGGGIDLNTAQGLIENCEFINNSADWGGAISARDESECEIAVNQILDNSAESGGGAIAIIDSTLSISKTAIYSNESVTGGALYLRASTEPNNLTVLNSIVHSNSASSVGGGAYIEDGSFTLVNSTLAHNQATTSAGSVFVESGAAAILDNMVSWQNTPDEFAANGSLSVNYSDVQGGSPGGVGNIDANPLFIDAMGPDMLPGTGDEDFRLLPGSPCIDAGDSTLSLIPETDFDGNPRFVDDPATADTGVGTPPIVDMGAFEFQTASMDTFACCLSTSECTVLSESDCKSAGGAPLTESPSCDGIDCSVAAIPTVSEWGLIAMTLLILTAGTMVYAQRQHRCEA